MGFVLPISYPQKSAKFRSLGSFVTGTEIKFCGSLRQGHRTGKMNISLYPFASENLVSRDGFGRPVPRQPAHLHTQAESGAYLTRFFPISAAASIC